MSLLLSATWRGGRLGQPTHQRPGLRHSNAALKTAPTPVENSRSSLGQHLPNRDGIAADLVLQQGLRHRKHPQPFLQVAKGWQKSHKDSLAAAAARFWAEAPYVCMRTETHCSLSAKHCHPDHDPQLHLLNHLLDELVGSPEVLRMGTFQETSQYLQKRSYL